MLCCLFSYVNSNTSCRASWCMFCNNGCMFYTNACHTLLHAFQWCRCYTGRWFLLARFTQVHVYHWCLLYTAASLHGCLLYTAASLHGCLLYTAAYFTPVLALLCYMFYIGACFTLVLALHRCLILVQVFNYCLLYTGACLHLLHWCLLYTSA